jgi:ABC-type Fe3+-hydroxamate transport system substrate-binding protein
VPSLTETLFALGAGERLVGRTRYCVAPDPQVRAVERVGGTKDPDITRIIALAPQLVLANKEENRREDIQALRDAGLNVHVSQPTTVEEGLACVDTLGRMFEREAVADTIIRRGVRALARLRLDAQDREEIDASRRRRRGRGQARPKVAAFIWKEPWMVAGPDTYISDMIFCLGGQNAFAGSIERYPQVTPAQLHLVGPDILLFPDEPWPFKQEEAEQWRELAPLIPAVREGRLRLCDGRDLCWFGARIPDALERLKPVVRW